MGGGGCDREDGGGRKWREDGEVGERMGEGERGWEKGSSRSELVQLTPWTGLGGGGKLFSHSLATSCCFSRRWNCTGREGRRVTQGLSMWTTTVLCTSSSCMHPHLPQR